jgi:hypothetical protein
MDDEEMAEEYIKVNNLEWELECNRTSPIGEVKQTYLAGLKAGRPEWYDLRKAKEIIKTFLGFAEAFGYSPSMDKFISEAEQFIKEGL